MSSPSLSPTSSSPPPSPLSTNIGVSDGNNPYDYSYASRTDSGVSALGNILVFSSPLPQKEIIGYLNSSLSGIVFHSFAEVSDSFNPRYASHRWYRYILPTDESPSGDMRIITGGKKIPFDLALARKAASHFIGTHNFSSFSKLEPDKDPMRTITSFDLALENRIAGLPPMVIIDIKGESFLWMMVRFMIGSLFKVISGEWNPETISELLSHPTMERKPTPVPPSPLILMENHYEGISFKKVPPPTNLFTMAMEYLLPDLEIWRNMYMDGAMK